MCKFAAELGATRLLLVETGPLKTSDSKYARIAAERLGTALEVVPQHFSSVRTAVETAVDLQDEPLAIISFVALANVAAEACVGSRVLLTGDGGDEVFGGYGSPMTGSRKSRSDRQFPERPSLSQLDERVWKTRSRL